MAHSGSNAKKKKTLQKVVKGLQWEWNKDTVRKCKSEARFCVA